MLLWVLACTATPVATDGPPTPTGDPTDAPTPTGDPTLEDPLDPLFEGTATYEAFAHQVAWDEGWPIVRGNQVTFVAAGPGPVHLAGDHNDWNPQPMDCEPAFCWLTVEIPAPEGLGYKLVRGDVYAADPLARSFTWDAFGELSYVAAPAAQHFERWPQVSGTGLLPRDLTVYHPGTTGPYRVLYAQDGQNLFDPNGEFGTWNLQAVAGEVLVVGIHNTEDRFDEYTHVADIVHDLGPDPVGGNGDAYADFVHTVVRPHIESTYGSTGIDGMMGSSLGGLISMHIAHRYPGEYDFVASLSGTLGWGRFGDLGQPIEERWLANDPGGVLFLYSGGGPGADGVCTDPDGDGYTEDDPDSRDNYCENRAAVDRFAAAGRTWDVDLFHWYEPGALHDEAAWGAIAHQPLNLFQGL